MKLSKHLTIVSLNKRGITSQFIASYAIVKTLIPIGARIYSFCIHQVFNAAVSALHLVMPLMESLDLYTRILDYSPAFSQSSLSFIYSH